MAEFQEVIKQWGRMLDAHRHGESIAIEASVPADAFKNAKLVEGIVMAWAAEHPEPVYPSWIEWLMSEGVIPTNYMAANSTDSGVRAGTFYVTSKAFEHIPADIAEKLGIEPKEVV